MSETSERTYPRESGRRPLGELRYPPLAECPEDVRASVEGCLPIWVVVRRPPLQNAVEGQTEESFSMDWSTDRVSIFWSGTAYSIFGEHQIDGERGARGNATSPYAVAYDLADPACPIEVDWEEWVLGRRLGVRDKYRIRNAPFRMRESVASPIDAEVAL